MEIRQVLLARAIQVFRTSSAPGYLPEIAEKIKTRYSFVIGPKPEDLLPPTQPSDEPKGAEFKHGRLITSAEPVIIQQLTLFTDGVVADTTTSTDDSDRFLTDLTRWAEKEIPNLSPVGHRLYVSQIEVKVDAPIENHMPHLRPAGEKIRDLLKGYGQETPHYEVSTLILSFDPIGKIPPQPGFFQIERRANLPYKENVWFAQAPLKTKDHIEILRELEQQALSGRSNP